MAAQPSRHVETPLVTPSEFAEAAKKAYEKEQQHSDTLETISGDKFAQRVKQESNDKAFKAVGKRAGFWEKQVEQFHKDSGGVKVLKLGVLGVGAYYGVKLLFKAIKKVVTTISNAASSALEKLTGFRNEALEKIVKGTLGTVLGVGTAGLIYKWVKDGAFSFEEIMAAWGSGGIEGGKNIIALIGSKVKEGTIEMTEDSLELLKKGFAKLGIPVAGLAVLKGAKDKATKAKDALKEKMKGKGEEKEAKKEEKENNEVLKPGYERWGVIRTRMQASFEKDLQGLIAGFREHKIQYGGAAIFLGIPGLMVQGAALSFGSLLALAKFAVGHKLIAASSIGVLSAYDQKYANMADDTWVPVTGATMIESLNLSTEQERYIQDHKDEVEGYMKGDVTFCELIHVEDLSEIKIIDIMAGYVNQFANPSHYESIYRTTVDGIVAFENVVNARLNEADKESFQNCMRGIYPSFESDRSKQTGKIPVLNQENINVLNTFLREKHIQISIEQEGDHFIYYANRDSEGRTKHYLSIVPGLEDDQYEILTSRFTAGDVEIQDYLGLFGQNAMESGYESLGDITEIVKQICSGNWIGAVKDGMFYVYKGGKMVLVGVWDTVSELILEEGESEAGKVLVQTYGTAVGMSLPFVLVGTAKSLVTGHPLKALGKVVAGPYTTVRGLTKTVYVGITAPKIMSRHAKWSLYERYNSLRGEFKPKGGDLDDLNNSAKRMKEMHSLYRKITRAASTPRGKTRARLFAEFMDDLVGVDGQVKGLKSDLGLSNTGDLKSALNNDNFKSVERRLSMRLEVENNRFNQLLAKYKYIDRVPAFRPGSNAGALAAKQLVVKQWGVYQDGLDSAWNKMPKSFAPGKEFDAFKSDVDDLVKKGYFKPDDMVSLRRSMSNGEVKEVQSILKRYMKGSSYEDLLKSASDTGFYRDPDFDAIKRQLDAMPHMDAASKADFLKKLQEPERAVAKHFRHISGVMGPAFALMSAYQIHTAKDKKKAFAEEIMGMSAYLVSARLVSKVVSADKIAKSPIIGTVLFVAATLGGTLALQFGMTAAELDGYIEKMLPDFGAGEFNQAIYEQLGDVTRSGTFAYIMGRSLQTKGLLSTLDGKILKAGMKTARRSSVIRNIAAGTVAKTAATKEALKGVGRRLSKSIVGKVSEKTIGVVLKRLAKTAGVKGGLKIAGSLASSVFTGPVGVGMAVWTAVDVAKVGLIMKKSWAVNDALEIQGDKEISNIELDKDGKRVFEEYYESARLKNGGDASGKRSWDDMTTEEQQTFIMQNYEKVQEKLENRSIVTLERPDGTSERYKYSGGVVKKITINTGDEVLELTEKELGEVDFDKVSFAKEEITKEQYDLILESKNPKAAAELFYATRILGYKEVTKFSQIDKEIKDAKTIEIKRHDLDGAITMKLNDSYEWDIYDGSTKLAHGMDFYQAMGLANLTLYSFARVKEYAQKDSNWRSEDGKKNPFRHNDDEIIYETDGFWSTDKDFIQKQIPLYKDNLGLSMGQMVESLNGYFGNHASKHNLLGN